MQVFLEEDIVRKSEFMERNKIKVKIALLFLMFVVLPFFILIMIAYYGLKDYIGNDFGKSMADTMTSICSQMHASMDVYKKCTMSLYHSGCVTMLETGEADEEYILSSLAASSYSYDDIKAIYLVMEDKVYTNGQYQYQNFLELMGPQEERIVRRGGKCVWFATDELAEVKKEMNYILSRSLNGKKTKNIGILYYVLDNKMVENVFKGLKMKDSKKYLIDENGNTLYSSSGDKWDDMISSELDQQFESGQESGYLFVNSGTDQKVVAYSRMKDTGWIFIGTVSIDAMMQTMSMLKDGIVVVAAVFCVFLILLFYTFQKSFLKPVSELQYAMNQFARGNMAVRMAENGDGELKSLSLNFNSMTEQISELMLRNEQAIQEKNNFKVQALTAQLKPHFIYNTLYTIKWMAVISKQNNIQQVTEALIYILMNALQNTNKEYTIQKEIDLIYQYAIIQKARFMNFEILMDIEEEAKQCRIFKFLLQPVVENSILHGFQKGETRDGVIGIRAWIEEKVLSIEIQDNGCGFEVEEWRKTEGAKEEHTSIGLKNIEQLIALEYGTEYGITIESRIGEGTKIRYRLPVQKGNGENDSDNYCG